MDLGLKTHAITDMVSGTSFHKGAVTGPLQEVFLIMSFSLDIRATQSNFILGCSRNCVKVCSCCTHACAMIDVYMEGCSLAWCQMHICGVCEAVSETSGVF